MRSTHTPRFDGAVAHFVTGERWSRHVFAEGLSAHGTRRFWKPGGALHDVSLDRVIHDARISNAGVTAGTTVDGISGYSRRERQDLSEGRFPACVN